MHQIYTLEENISSRKKAGHPALFSNSVENVFIDYMNCVGDWGPFDMMDLRHMAKYYRDSRRIEKSQLKDDFLVVDWANGFMNRHRDKNVFSLRDWHFSSISSSQTISGELKTPRW